MNTPVKILRGHKLLKADESMGGQTVVLAQVSTRLCAVYSMIAPGHADDPVYAPRRRANGIFEARLMSA